MRVHALQSEEYQEYEYLLKWKGYGEEENSWVPASSMNCWELLQAYLSKNIFKRSKTVSLSTPRPVIISAPPSKPRTQSNSTPHTKSKFHHSNSTSAKLKVLSKPKTVRLKVKDDPSSQKDILVSNALHSTTSRGTLRLHLSETTTTASRSVLSTHQHSRCGTERGGMKKNGHFSTPKHLPSLVRFNRQKSSPQGRHKFKSLLKQKTVVSNGTDKNSVLTSPSVSPLLSSCDDSSSLQSDGSMSVDETFRLHLDSDDDSVSGSHGLSGESPFLPTDQPCQNHVSPKVRPNISSSSQKKKQHNLNGLSHTVMHLQSEAKFSEDPMPSRPSAKSKRTVLNRNGIIQPTPTSTTQSATENSSDSSESWSKRRLRKRAHSSSPTPSPPLVLSHVSSNACSVGSSSIYSTGISGGSCLAEVTSTTSPQISKGFHHHALTLPLTSALISLASQSTDQVPSQVMVPQRQISSAEYQQELLEWQFMLNKQCRPAEAFILVENRIDQAPIPWGFKYITKNLYGDGVPDPKNPEVAKRICGCTCYYMGKKCGPRNQHCCPKMAGAEFSYTLAGKIRIPPGNPIYECNSHCSCPQDCINRVVQRGRKINMSIFRTSNGRGWGVKTMEPIKPNTFVTEYVGEVVTTEEAERRGELYDQEGRTYLFDLDFTCDDNQFTIDAAHYGNISHFFNHSVS